ncbi:MAG: hypothetical protein JSW48_01670 [Betaproteobacteria bacterium]|nr:MAG: hypothetical protein JSW48_01670 [Betaproteobacteria bacterium]
MAPWRKQKVVMSDQARNTLTGYVSSAGQSAGMVTNGHAIARWLPRG